MVIVASWILAIVLAVAFTSAGYAKVTEQPMMVRARGHLGLSSNAYRAVGVAELAGAFGVMIGLLAPLTWIGLAAAGGLFALMIGAVSCHLRVQDALGELYPALAMALLSILYLSFLAAG